MLFRVQREVYSPEYYVKKTVSLTVLGEIKKKDTLFKFSDREDSEKQCWHLHRYRFGRLFEMRTVNAYSVVFQHLPAPNVFLAVTTVGAAEAL